MTFTLNAMPRTAWGGSASSPGSYGPTASGIVVHWNGPPMGNYSEADVPDLVAGTRDFHVNGNGWSDIAYNYAVDRFGRVWTGRGYQVWNAASGDSNANYNLLAVECLCGKGDPFTADMKRGLAEVAAAYVAGGNARACYGHRDIVATECPGDEIMAYVRLLNRNMQVGQFDIQLGPPPAADTGEYEMPEYLIKASTGTMFGVYAEGKVRELIYPELQYITKRDSDIIVVDSGKVENDIIIRQRSLLP